MDLDTESVVSKPSRKENKNYAPVDPRLNTIEKSDCNAKFAARQEKARLAHNRERIHAPLIAKAYDPWIERQRKQHNRTGYKQRAGDLKNLPFFLTPDRAHDMTLDERMMAYGKRHRCKHNMAFNRVEMKIVDRHITYVPYCDHDRKRSFRGKPRRCPYCFANGTVSRFDIVLLEGDVKCDCSKGYCSHCKRTIYAKMDKVYCYDPCTRQIEGYVTNHRATTVAPWSSMTKVMQPMEPIVEEKEIPDSIGGYKEPTQIGEEPFIIPGDLEERMNINPNKVYTLEELARTFKTVTMEMEMENESTNDIVRDFELGASYSISTNMNTHAENENKNAQNEDLNTENVGVVAIAEPADLTRAWAEGDVRRTIQLKIARIPRKRPAWTKPGARDDFIFLVNGFRDFHDLEKESAGYLYDRLWASYYLHFMGFNQPHEFEYNYGVYGSFIKRRTGFDKLELEELFRSEFKMYLHDGRVKTVADLLKHIYLEESPMRNVQAEIEVLTNLWGSINGIAKSISDSILSVLSNLKSSIADFYGRLKTTIVESAIYKRFQGFIERLSFVVSYALDMFRENPLLIAPLAADFVEIATKPFKEVKWTTWLSLFGLLCGSMKGVVEAYKEKFCKKKTVEERAREQRSAFFPNLERKEEEKPGFFSVLGSFFYGNARQGDDEHDEKLERELLALRETEDDSFYEVEGMVDDAKDFFSNALGYTKGQFNRFYQFIKPFLDYFHIQPKYWLAFAGSIKTFTAVMAGAKSMVWFVSHFSRWFPQFIVDALVSSNTRDFIATELRRKGSPFQEATQAAMAMELALTTGRVDEIADVKALARVKQEALLKYIQDQKIPVDADMTVFLKNLKQYLYAPSVSKNKAMEPFTVLLSGDPGVGKSVLTIPLLSTLVHVPDEVKDEEMAEYVESFVFTRNVVTDTWDGYTGQPIIRYDDLGQFTQGQDFLEVIGLKTTAPYYPAFASIDPRDEHTVGVKGMKAEPKVVFATSNMSQLRTDTVTNLQALNRRWDVHFIVRYKPGFNETMVRPKDNSHISIVVVRSGKATGEIFAERQQEIEGSFEEKVEQMQKILFDAYNAHCDKQILLKKKMVATMVRFNSPHLLRHTKAEMNETVEYLMMRGAQLLIQLQTTGSLMVGFDKTLSFLVPYVKNPTYLGILRFGAIIASIVGATMLVSNLFKTIVVPESGETKDRKGKQLIKVQPEDEATKELYQILSERNLVKLRRTGIDNLGLSAMFVEGNILLVPEHFFLDRTGVGKYIPKDSVISLQCPVTKAEVQFVFDPTQLTLLKNNKGQEIDAVLYRCPPNITQRKTITQHFSDASIDLKNRPVIMGKWNPHGVQYFHGKIIADDLKIQYEKAGRKGEKYQIHNSFEYDIQTGSGDCGSPLMIQGLGAMKGSIVGIHVAGDHGVMGSSGFGTLITRSMLETGLKQIQKEKPYFTEAIPEMGWKWKEATADDLAESRLEGTITLAHLAPIKIVPPFDCKEIQPSPLFDQISVHTTEPVKMRVRGRDMFLEGVLKYKMQAKPLGELNSEIVLEHLKRQIYPLKSVSPREKVTTFVAMNGAWEYPYLDRLDYDTSAGFPYYGKKKAEVCVRDESGDYYPTEDLYANIERIRNQIASRVVPVDPIFDSLKVERKKIKYDDKGNRVYKTRLFSACPFTTLILMKEYFSGFFSHMVQTRIRHFSAVGMNKEIEFHKIAAKHLAINDLHYDFDYQHFDGVKDIEGNYFVVTRLIVDFFEDREYTNHRETLLRWAMSSPHQFREFLIWIIGCSSGVYMTELMQSIDNAVNIRGEWLRLAPHPYKTMTHFDRNVTDTNYGDDLILTVSEFAEEFFSGEMIRTGLKERGVTITPADKVSTIIARKPITEISFLKCRFTLIGDRYYPQMELDDLLETINWIRVKVDSPLPEEACEANCRDVMRGMFYHGEEVYNKYYNLILSKRPTYRIYQYKELLNEFRDKGMIADLAGVHTLGSHQEVERSDYYDRLETKYEVLVGSVQRGSEDQMMMEKRVVAEMEAADVQPGQAAVESVGVELVNQKNPTTTSIPMKVSSKAMKINPETPFTLEMSLKRFTKFDDLNITATPTPGQVIKTWDVIEDLLTGSNTYPFIQFLRWKCKKITIQVQVTGCQFSSGKDILCWRPTMKDKSAIVRPVTLDEAILLEHIAINPTSNTTAELVISPTFYKEWLSLDQKNQYGQLVLIRQNPFGVGSGPASYGLKLLASFEEADFILPAPLAPSRRTVKQTRDRMDRVFRQEVEPRIPRMVSPEMEIQENADPNELPLYVFAVGSGETSDTNPPHWGEKYVSFQDMIKRQQPAAYLEVTHVATDFGVPQTKVFPFQTGYTASVGGGFLRKVSLPFRVCKIPRRYVVKARIVTDSTGLLSVHGYVGYLPVGVQTPLTVPNVASLSGAFPNTGVKKQTALPYSYFDNDTLAEIEVPYTNPCSVALIPQDFENDIGLPSQRNYVDEMRIVVNYVLSGADSGCKVVFEIFEMAADEARVGVFVAMPYAAILSNEWPDLYEDGRNVVAEAGIVGGIVTKVGHALEDVVKDVLPDSVTGLASDLLGSMLDVPNVSTAPELMRLKKRGYYSNTSQVVMLERLSASAGAMQPLDPGDIGTTRDEMKLIDFAKRRALVHTMAIPVTTPAEYLLKSFQVGPFMFKEYNTRTTMLPIDYVAHGMQYWRGGIEFEVEFVTSNYDEFKIEVAFSPDTSTPPNYESASTQYYKSVLVKGTNNRFRFKVPHFAEMPWKQIYNGQIISSSNPEQYFASDYSHGIIQFFLGSNISSPNTTPNTVYMNVYVRAADDFEVAVPSMINTSIIVGAPAPTLRKSDRKL